MIEVNKAIEIIEVNSAKMPTKLIAVGKALGYVLAQKVISPIRYASVSSVGDGWICFYTQ